MAILVEQTASKTETQLPEFSLVPGEPLDQLLLCSNLIIPRLGHVGWFADNVKVSFLYDFGVYARLLFVLPVLILAELLVYVRGRTLAAQFIDRHLVAKKTRPAFDLVISSAMHLRKSLAAEIALLLLVIVASPQAWRSGLALRADTWYTNVANSSLSYTPAGYYYIFLSVGKETILRFLTVMTLPLSPLVFRMFSAEELLKRLVSILL